MIYSRNWWVLLAGLLFLGADSARAQQGAEFATAARRQRVENGLLPAVRLKDRPPVVWSLAERMRNYHVPGVSIVVINGGEIAWAQGYGVREQGKAAPVTPETRFQAGSASPVGLFTALPYVRQGDLALDADIAPLLKTWKLPANEVTERHKVTLRTLLTHSATLTGVGTHGYAPGARMPTPVEVLDGIAPATNRALDVNSVPGVHADRFEASVDLMMIQRVLEDLTGKPYPVIAQQAVLTPFGMHHSGYTDPERENTDADIATGHVGAETLPQRWHCYPGDLEQQLWTTPTDLASLLREIVQGASGKSERLLPQEFARQIMTSQLPDQGLGFQVYGSGKSLKLVLRGGSDGYYTALVLYPETGQGAVIMTNGERSDLLTEEILRGLAAEYGWPDALPRERVATTLPSQTLSVYEGWYSAKPDISSTLMQIRKEGEKLFLHCAGVPARFHPPQEVELFSVAKDSFCYREEDALLTFVRNRQGEVDGLTFRRDNDVFYDSRQTSPPVIFSTPPVDPDPKRTERLRRAIAEWGHSPQTSRDLSDFWNGHLNLLIPMGIADLQPGELVFLHRELLPPGLDQAEYVYYRTNRTGKPRYYRFGFAPTGILNSISEIPLVW